MENKGLGLAGILTGMVLFVVVAFLCVTRIGPGYAGVVYNMDGGIEDESGQNHQGRREATKQGDRPPEC